MHTCTRPWITTGLALATAGVVAATPITPVPPALDMRAAAAAATVSCEPQLMALDIPYFLTFPIVRQAIRNWAENWAVYLGGLAGAGVGLVQSILAIPGVAVAITQQVLNLDFVGAFETFTNAVRDSVVAVGEPLLNSLIWRNQKYLAVQTALQAARPQAIIAVTNGFLEAANGVTVSAITGTQNLIAAVLTFNLSNIINTAVDGTVDFVQALGQGAQDIIAGVETAQYLVATALATPPPGMVAEAAERSVAPEQSVATTPETGRHAKLFTLDVAKPLGLTSTDTADTDSPRFSKLRAITSTTQDTSATKTERPRPVKTALKSISDSVEKAADRAEDSVAKVTKAAKATRSEAAKATGIGKHRKDKEPAGAAAE